MIEYRVSDRKMTVTEASRHFSDLVNRTYYRGESTTLFKSGEPVARVIPLTEYGVGASGRDWLSKWREMPHLGDKQASDFAEDVESARDELSLPVSPWE